MPRLAAFVLPLAVFAAGPTPAEFFESRIRPLLVKHCHACHTAAKMGGLELTSRDAMLKGGSRGPAIRAGAPAESLLLRAVRYSDGTLKMPPSGKLADSEIDGLAVWIKDGAIWPDHPARQAPTAGYTITPEHRSWWSFRPVEKPVAPIVKDTRWPRTGIDRFILARLEKQSLRPVAPAHKRTLIRRAYFDLTGLPPTPADVDAFLNDNSTGAFASVVDRLLTSSAYGERWGRYWLDVARYSDDRLNSTQDDPYPNAWRFRDWVIRAFNDDMPYDKFLKAQIAGDQMDDPQRYAGGLGLFALSPEFQDDRLDVVGRGLLGLTIACAQCHDHKFDPIPTKDYYSLLGVFRNTRPGEFPLAPKDTVALYQAAKKAVAEQEKRILDFQDAQARQLAEIFASRAAEYLRAVRDQSGAEASSLDPETYARWDNYLRNHKKEHPFLDAWNQPAFDADAFQAKLLAAIQQKKEVDQDNLIRLGGKDDARTVRVIEVRSLDRDPFFLWRDLVSPDRFGKFESGILYYKAVKLDRFLSGPWKSHLDSLRAELDRRKKAVPEPYPFYQVIEDVKEPKNIQVEIRGSRDNLGEEAPRRFLQILSQGEPKLFARGAGRLDLANAIADPANPLTARVIVNRVWLHHFGRGLVGTPGNFGQLGEKPTHPELLDFLAARFIENGWSLKSLHRDIMNSAVYALSCAHDDALYAADPANTLLGRFSRRRLDAEPLRDTLLALAGELDPASGGPPVKLSDSANKRRTIYGFVSRRKLESDLALFDFPNPISLSEQRIQTATPIQQLFFLNSPFIQARASAVSARLTAAAPDDPARIRHAYRTLFQRLPTGEELATGIEYLRANGGGAWPRYAQALLTSNEVLFVD